MSLYVLDTDTLSLYERGHPAVHQKRGTHKADEVAITVITVEEQLTGWYTSLRTAKTPDKLAWACDRLIQAVKLLAGLPILPCTAAAVQRYEQLKAQKLNVAKMDLRIAAVTLEHGGTLVTRNVRDVQRVPGLVIEDWTV
jgi:tRNA(fMet)-specific endonuclease VapC